MTLKKIIKTCYKCEANVKEAKVRKEGRLLSCFKCPKCGEEYFTASALLKHFTALHSKVKTKLTEKEIVKECHKTRPRTHR